MPSSLRHRFHPPAAVCLALLLASGACLAQSIGEQQDAMVIDNLVAAGSDVTRPHDIDFHLLFPTRIAAGAAAAELTAQGYAVVAIAERHGPHHWELHATRRMVPTLEAMTASTRSLEALAVRHDGNYEGWGTQVVD